MFVFTNAVCAEANCTQKESAEKRISFFTRAGFGYSRNERNQHFLMWDGMFIYTGDEWINVNKRGERKPVELFITLIISDYLR